MKKYSLVLATVLVLITHLHASQKVSIDNLQLQEYKGHIGKWMFITKKRELTIHILKFQTTLEKVKIINNKIKNNSYVFIPYSDNYIKTLQNHGNKRIQITSVNDHLIWPMEDVIRISSSFGMRAGKLHTGVDLPAAKGTPVIAAMPGRVVFSGYAGGHGNSILIEHKNNLFTRYSHNSVNLMKKGDFVKKGQIIALAGSTGNSTGSHIHFEVRYNDIPLNPLDFLPRKTNIKQVHYFRRNWK